MSGNLRIFQENFSRRLEKLGEKQISLQKISENCNQTLEKFQKNAKTGRKLKSNCEKILENDKILNNFIIL